MWYQVSGFFFILIAVCTDLDRIELHGVGHLYVYVSVVSFMGRQLTV